MSDCVHLEKILGMDYPTCFMTGNACSGMAWCEAYEPEDKEDEEIKPRACDCDNYIITGEQSPFCGLKGIPKQNCDIENCKDFTPKRKPQDGQKEADNEKR